MDIKLVICCLKNFHDLLVKFTYGLNKNLVVGSRNEIKLLDYHAIIPFSMKFNILV
jgi:hypothetical protein